MDKWDNIVEPLEKKLKLGLMVNRPLELSAIGAWHLAKLLRELVQNIDHYRERNLNCFIIGLSFGFTAGFIIGTWMWFKS